jgi:hypothetical protein
MSSLWRFAPWLNRLILLLPTALFMILSLHILTDPERSASDHGLSLDTPVGLTNYRSGNGGLLVALALFTLYCLVSERRHLIGLSLVATLMGVILILRGASATIDGTLPQQTRLLVAESVFLALSLAGVWLETTRHRAARAVPLEQPLATGAAR